MIQEVLEQKMTVYEFAGMEIPDDATYTYELLNGELVRKNAPSGEHQFAHGKLMFHLTQAIIGKHLGMVFSAPTSVILSELDAPQPDIAVLLNDSMHKYDPEWGIRGAPNLLVEIISPSSYRLDRTEKKQLCEQHGVREYWLVDPLYKSIEIFALKDGRFRSESFGYEGETVFSAVLDGFELNLGEVFSGR